MYEAKRLSLPEIRRMGRKEWRNRFPGPTFFIAGKDKLGYFCEQAYLKAKSGPHFGGAVDPDSCVAILDTELQKLRIKSWQFQSLVEMHSLPFSRALVHLRRVRFFGSAVELTGSTHVFRLPFQVRLKDRCSKTG